VLDTETHPPDVQLRESVNASRRERDAIVGADRARQAMRAKQTIEDRAHPWPFVDPRPCQAIRNRVCWSAMVNG